MMKNQLPYNPVFESLASQVEKYSKPHTFEIYEAEGDMPADKVQKYLILVLNTLQYNVFKFVQSAPFPDLRDQTMNNLIEKAEALKKNSSIADLFGSLSSIWNDAYQKASQHKEKKMIMPFYDKVNEGIENVLTAYKNLKTAAGNKLEDPNLLAMVNSQMSETMDTFKKSIEDAKRQLQSGMKK